MNELDADIGQAYRPDQRRLARALARIQSLKPEHPRRAIDFERWQNALQKSIERRANREGLDVSLEYDSELPIVAHRNEILSLLCERQVLIVCGETGSGKSTQLPKLCLEAGFGRRAMIGHTQPRRIAARTIAHRLKDELSLPTHDKTTIGYKVRFNDATSPTTLIKLMTDGVLLAELPRDRFLDAYEVILIDEAHERSLNIDLLMAHLRWLLPRRRDLKLIITSATIDAERFAEHFSDQQGPAPIVNVAGRTFPVEIRYLGNEALAASSDVRMSTAVDTLMSETRGDILVFLPTERDIRLTHRLLQGHLQNQASRDKVEILPLYARLTEAEQQRIFQPHKQRRIVLATNVAESSLTVPGIFSVIDTGTVRLSRYSPRSKVQRLPIEPISQASANQRAGRCGRLGAGICIRLYDEADFLGRPAFTTPEIHRTDLASAILLAAALKLGNLAELEFLDPPRSEMVRDGVNTLREIGAMTDSDQLTSTGRLLSRWPISPRVGRILIEANKQGCLSDVMIIASALEAQDPRLRPIEKQSDADAAHQKFADPNSDFLSYLRIWDFYHRLKGELGRNRLEKACRENYLSLSRLHEWMDLHRQLHELVTQAGWRIGSRRLLPTDDMLDPKSPLPVAFEDIHRALLSGLLSGIAYQDDERRYKGAGNIELHLWPGSGVRSIRPKWIVACEVVETHIRYARTVASIEPGWVVELARHLLKRQHDGPHFSQKRGAAMIHERATLFGMPIVPRHAVPLAPIDPALARRLLIDQGLVEKKLESRAAFVRHNHQLLDDVAAWASRTRRRDLVVDPFFLQQFYDRTLPEQVIDRATLEAFDRSIPIATPSRNSNPTREQRSTTNTKVSIPNALRPSQLKSSQPVERTLEQSDRPTSSMPPTHEVYLTWEAIHESFDRKDAEVQFPTKLDLGATRLNIDYRFAPGADDDGLTVRIPEQAVAQLSEEKLGWIVPGLLEEKVVQLIKTLPKNLRRNLVPAPAVAAKAMPELLLKRDQQAPFWPSLCQVLGRLAGEPIRVGDFEPSKLDSHLRIRVAVVDDRGQVKQTSREVEGVKSKASTRVAPAPIDSVANLPAWFQERWTTFAVDEIPRTLVVSQHGVRCQRFVALSDKSDSCQPSLWDYAEQASAAMQLGLVRLFVLADTRELRSHVQHLPAVGDAQVKLGNRVQASLFSNQLRDLIARIAFLESEANDIDRQIVWKKSDFELRRVDRLRRLSQAAVEVGLWLPKLSKSYHELRLMLPTSAASWKEPLDDVNAQLSDMFRISFLSQTPWEWLREYPRYLDAIKHRITRWKSGGLVQDIKHLESIRQFQKQIRNLANQRPQWSYLLASNLSSGEKTPTPEWIGPLQTLRWNLEEYRVSLFAQQLGTKVSISAKRLDKLILDASSQG